MRYCLKIFITVLLLCRTLSMFAQKEVDVLDLGLGGKITNTENPFHRFNADEHPEVFNDNRYLEGQIRTSAGMFVHFRSNTKNIRVRAEYCKPTHSDGFSLYIKKDGRWVYAGSQPVCGNAKTLDIVRYMDGSYHDCLLYMPAKHPLKSAKLLIDEDADIQSLEAPFKHRIAALGSSFTQGAGTSRPGMSWPDQLSRMTGLMFINMGFSGNCKLQPFYAKVLGASDVEAYVIDGFSNPTDEQIRDRLVIFLETLRDAEDKAGKGHKPVIFLKTIWREGNNFNETKREREEKKLRAATEMMDYVMKNYEGVYWVTSTYAADKYHETCTDGTHPNDYGYTVWAESIMKPVLKILSSYGIKRVSR